MFASLAGYAAAPLVYTRCAPVYAAFGRWVYGRSFGTPV